MRSESPAFDLHHPDIAALDAPDHAGRAEHLRGTGPGPDPDAGPQGQDSGSGKPFVKRLLTALFVLLAIGAALGAMLLIGIRFS